MDRKGLLSCSAVGVDGGLISSEIILSVCIGFSSPYPIFCTVQTKFGDTCSTVSIAYADIHVRFSSCRHAYFNDSMKRKAM